MESNFLDNMASKEVAKAGSRQVTAWFHMAVLVTRVEGRRLKDQTRSVSEISRIRRNRREIPHAVLLTYPILSQLACLPTHQDLRKSLIERYKAAFLEAAKTISLPHQGSRPLCPATMKVK